MTFHVREGIGATLARALLALVFMGVAMLISEFSARQLEVKSSTSASTQADHSAKHY